jgi:hypothetical protein
MTNLFLYFVNCCRSLRVEKTFLQIMLDGDPPLVIASNMFCLKLRRTAKTYNKKRGGVVLFNKSITLQH